MNQDFYSQGTPYVQVPVRQKTQPHSALANPTSYHLQQRELKNQKQFPSDGTPGAPPTPSNSYQNNLLNSFADSTIDPQILNRQQLRFMNPIKHESEIMDEFDSSNTVTSPQSNNSCGDSPQNHSYGGSPQGHIYGAGAGADDTFGRSFKPTSVMDSFFESTNSSLYSPNTNIDNNLEYSNSYEDFQPLSAPSSTSINIDVKTNMNNNNPKVNFRQPHNNLNQISMSLPVIANSNPEGWQFGTSLDAHAGSLQYPHADMSIMNSGGFIDPDESDQKAAALYEKRKRRRESHNAVERRRRDNINEKIQELSTLLPDLFVDSANKPNKGVILRKSVDYIRHLKQVYEQERLKNERLASQLSKTGTPIDNNSGSDQN